MSDKNFYADLVRQDRARCDPELLRRMDQSKRPSPDRFLTEALGSGDFNTEESKAILASPKLQRYKNDMQDAVSKFLAFVRSESSQTLDFPTELHSTTELPRVMAADGASSAEPPKRDGSWSDALTPVWREPLPFPPPQLSYTCRLCTLPDGRHLVLTIAGLDKCRGARFRALLQKNTVSLVELPANGWTESNTCAVMVPENVREKADLKGYHLLLFLATRENDRYVELLQSPMLVSFD